MTTKLQTWLLSFKMPPHDMLLSFSMGFSLFLVAFAAGLLSPVGSVSIPTHAAFYSLINVALHRIVFY